MDLASPALCLNVLLICFSYYLEGWLPHGRNFYLLCSLVFPRFQEEDRNSVSFGEWMYAWVGEGRASTALYSVFQLWGLWAVKSMVKGSLSPLYQYGLHNHMRKQASPGPDVIHFHSVAQLLHCGFLHAPRPVPKGHGHPVLSAIPQPPKVVYRKFLKWDKYISMGNSLYLINILFYYIYLNIYCIHPYFSPTA